MITEYMKLTTRRDADTWAAQFDLPDAAKARLADWIWANKPCVGVTYASHPLSDLYSEQIYEIANEMQRREDAQGRESGR